AAREEHRRGTRRGLLAALVARAQLHVYRRPPAVGEIGTAHAAAEPLRVADVVEPAELAVELPEPGVVAHPVGAEMDEPRLAHAPVVERGRVARASRELGIPVT